MSPTFNTAGVNQAYLRIPCRATPVELHDAHALLPRLAGCMPDAITHEPNLGIDVEVAVVVDQLQPSRNTRSEKSVWLIYTTHIVYHVQCLGCLFMARLRSTVGTVFAVSLISSVIDNNQIKINE